MSGLFDIIDAGSFFGSIKRCYDGYQESRIKRTEDLLYIFLGLNHLREWIAPGYHHKNSARTEAERFYNAIFETKEFKTLNQLANGTKHTNAMKTGYAGGAPIDDWDDFDSVAEVDKGPPTAHFVDERPVEEIISPLIQLYEDWFSGCYHP